MSTVVYKDGIMAGETLAVCSDERYGGVEKVGRTENYLFGFAGRLGYMRPTYKWIEALDKEGVHPQDFFMHADRLMVDEGEHDGACIIADRDGNLWFIELDGHTHPVTRPFESIGSGGRYALGAIAHGASAVEAIECASMLDVNSGERIMSWTFDDPVHCPNEKSA